MDIQRVAQFIGQTAQDSRIYLGCDSERYFRRGAWFAAYTRVVVIHHGGAHGCKIFGHTEHKRDFDPRPSRPVTRMMEEVYAVSALYLELAEAIAERPVEVHLDINPDERHGSSCAVREAIGYVRGVCQLTPKLKPEAFAASCAADQFTRKCA